MSYTRQVSAEYWTISFAGSIMPSGPFYTTEHEAISAARNTGYDQNTASPVRVRVTVERLLEEHLP